MTSTVPGTTPDEDVLEAGHVDIVIVGAGVSGIGAAHHVRERFPGRSLLILEAKDGHGGTWWTHRYPGVRSDSDLFTYGYRFKPWRGEAIASGPTILSYLGGVIAEDGLGTSIRYRHKVTSAHWSTADRQWTVQVTRADTGERLRFTTGFLWMCSGYSNHDKPHQPRWAGMDQYQGVVIHPQRWPEDLDVGGKRVIVIGSGATAATLIPAIADDAAHVTMLQRSPTYFFAPPRQNELAVTLRDLDIPEEWTYEILRRVYIKQGDFLVKTAFEDPAALHEHFIESMRPQLPEGFDVDKHFTPRYRPWQQRIGVVPDGDFFAALRSGKASIVTDTIETFSGVPNMAYVFGYLRYSWTLRADMVCELVTSMLERMEKAGATMVVPSMRAQDAGMERRPFCDPENFSAGYIMRSQDSLFKQGDREPWIHLLEYQERDTLPKADLDDGSLVYS
jgi:monooxygenase